MEPERGRYIVHAIAKGPADSLTVDQTMQKKVGMSSWKSREARDMIVPIDLLLLLFLLIVGIAALW